MTWNPASDANKDGFLTLALTLTLTLTLTESDDDKDGFLTLEEVGQMLTLQLGIPR